MTLIAGIDPEELRVREGQYPSSEDPLEAAWSFWYDKKTSDRQESDQYMEGLKQLGSFNTIQGFYRHYTYLLRPSELPRDQNLLLFRKGYKPMWEEFPEGGCWIIRIKRKVSQSYVNRMWENLLLACIGEEFEMPDVVGCVLSTRLKDDALSIWNISNRDTPARFRIGEKLKEILDLDMSALIQYKDHMQSLQDYSTYRNAKNYMFAPSPNVTPMQSTLETPLVTMQEDPIGGLSDVEFVVTGMEDADFDEMLPPAAVDTGGFDAEPSWSVTAAEPCSSAAQACASPLLSAAASPWLPNLEATAVHSPALSAAAAPWQPYSPALSAAAAPWQPSKSAGLSADAEVFKPKESTAAEIAAPAPMSSAPAAPMTAAEPTAAAAAGAGAEAAAVGEGNTGAGVSDDPASSPLEATAAALAEVDTLAGGCDDPASVASAGAAATPSGVKASAGEAEESTGDTVDIAMFPSLGSDRTPTRSGPESPSRSWASVVASRSAGISGAGASGSPTARKGAGPKAGAKPGAGL